MTEQLADTFDAAFSKAVDLGNRIADKDKDADLWDIADGLLAGALQYWLADQLWLKGGIGVANISLSDPTGADYGNSESALGLLAAGGFEALQGSTFALDVQLRLGYGAYSSGGASNVAVLVGLNWY